MESTAQWMKKTTTNAWKTPGRASPCCGDPRQRERPDDEDRAQEEERVRKPPVRGVERVREAEEEVREDDEERDDQAAVCALGEIAGVVRDQAQQLEEAERAEGDRSPPGCEVSAAPPEDKGDRTERDVRDKVDVMKDLDRNVQGPLPGGRVTVGLYVRRRLA